MIVRPEDIKYVYIQRLVYSLLGLQVAHWTTCYVLAITKGQMTYPNFFLSKAMEYDPSRMIANITTPIISLLTAAILFLRVILLKQVIRTSLQKILWKIFTASSVILPLAMIAVPAIPYSNSNWGHLIPAFLVFTSSFAIMATASWLDYSLKLPIPRWMRHCRHCLTLGALCGSIVFGIFFWPDPFISSIFELIAAGCVTLYITSLAHPDDFFGQESSVKAKEGVNESSDSVTTVEP